MGPIARAEAVFSRARARNAAAICPGEARSPMDADVTVTVPRVLIAACEAAVGAVAAVAAAPATG